MCDSFKTVPVVTIYFFSAVFLMFVECDSARPHSFLRDREVDLRRLNGYMNSIGSPKVLVKSLNKKVQMEETSLYQGSRNRKTLMRKESF